MMAKKTFRPLKNHMLVGREIVFDTADPTGSRIISIIGLPYFGLASVWERCEDFLVLEQHERRIATGAVVGDCAVGCYGTAKKVTCPAAFYLLEITEDNVVRCVFDETSFNRHERTPVENRYEINVLSLGGCELDECCHTVDIYKPC